MKDSYTLSTDKSCIIKRLPDIDGFHGFSISAKLYEDDIDMHMPQNKKMQKMQNTFQSTSFFTDVKGGCQ